MFEDENPTDGGRKEERIRRSFGFSAVRYQQLLLGMLDRQDAEAEFPQLVHRLRRQAVLRRDARYGRSVA